MYIDLLSRDRTLRSTVSSTGISKHVLYFHPDLLLGKSVRILAIAPGFLKAHEPAQSSSLTCKQTVNPKHPKDDQPLCVHTAYMQSRCRMPGNLRHTATAHVWINIIVPRCKLISSSGHIRALQMPRSVKMFCRTPQRHSQPSTALAHQPLQGHLQFLPREILATNTRSLEININSWQVSS